AAGGPRPRARKRPQTGCRPARGQRLLPRGPDPNPLRARRVRSAGASVRPGPEPRRCRGEGTTPRHATTPRRRPGLSPPSVAIAGFGRPPPTTAAGPVSDIPPRYRTHRTGKDRRPTGRPVHARTRATP